MPDCFREIRSIAVTHPESHGNFPSGITIKRVDYASHSDLVDAFKDQDALVITLTPDTPREQQTKFTKAAAEAGVP